MMKAGVIVDCFQKGLYEGIKLAAEREAGDNRYEDIKNGIAFLKSLR